MDVQHTPGPWAVHLAFAHDAEREWERNVATANARLIAAAPDMLAALEKIDRINGSTGGAAALVAEFKFLARVAIAKARGEG